MNLDLQQIIIQIIAFLVMVWVLKKFGWKPLLNIMEERRAKIQGEFDAIENQKLEMKKLTDEYNERLRNIDSEARAKIQEGVKEGRKIAQEIQEKTQMQAREIIAKAKSEIEKEISNVKKELKNEIINIAFMASEKILQEKIDDEKQRKLIADFVEHAELK